MQKKLMPLVSATLLFSLSHIPLALAADADKTSAKNRLINAGIITGNGIATTGDATDQPDQGLLPRADAAKKLLEALNQAPKQEQQTQPTHGFTDVQTQHWAIQEISAARQLKNTDGTFDNNAQIENLPMALVAKQQFVVKTLYQVEQQVKANPEQAANIVKEAIAKNPELAEQIAEAAAKAAPDYAQQIAEAAVAAAPDKAQAITNAVLKVAPPEQAQAIKDAVNAISLKPQSPSNSTGQSPLNTGMIPGASGGGGGGGAASPSGNLL